MALVYDHLFKFLLVGDTKVGKSALIHRFVEDAFVESYDVTIGVDFKIHTITIGGKTVRLQLWDTAGQERFRIMTAAFYRNALGIAIVYDVTDMESFNNIRYWLTEVEKYSPGNFNRFLIGNKSDLASKKVVDTEMAKSYADSYNLEFIETSAKSASNVEEAFVRMATAIKARISAQMLNDNRGGNSVALSRKRRWAGQGGNCFV